MTAALLTEGRLPEAFGWRSGVRLPRAGSQPALGRPGAPPGGHYGLPAESRLIRTAQMPFWKARPGNAKKPRWSAERRAGRRHRPVDLRNISPEIGPTARRATGGAFPTSACRRSAPLDFCGGTRDRRPPRRKELGAAERWLINPSPEGRVASVASRVGQRCTMMSLVIAHRLPHPAACGGDPPHEGEG
jgi:hypothetical protein